MEANFVKYFITANLMSIDMHDTLLIQSDRSLNAIVILYDG